MTNSTAATNENGLEIAIIGMAGRFPGARNIEEYWRNLREGVESISFFTDEQMLKIGISPEVVSDPKFVKAGGVLEDIELFDSQLFGFNPREADIMDPQHRLFLECSYEALENAGYDAERYNGRIGVYAGGGVNSYLISIVASDPNFITSVGHFQALIGNDKDFLSTRVSYKLKLEGPSVTVQTACSTSLVAVHIACQSLLSGECDAALAGGISIRIPQKVGYVYQEGGIFSPDGHCRAFDRKARGTVGGNGVGVVVLKRLPDAITDGDTIHAVIKGSAINNDGSSKVGYTAPSMTGQAKVISAALTISDVHPETIGYIEAHGTGTALGDPIEVAALTQAFSATTTSKQFCAIGSVKTNIGHLDAAAGIAGLIKAVLAVEHGQIPPSLHYSEPNPEIEFSNSPFYVSERLSEWGGGGRMRRAGVSSFGIGGTNAHVIIEEWGRQEQERGQEEESRGRPEVVMISARSLEALEETSERLRRHLEEGRGGRLEDVAYTLQEGRKAYEHRRVIVASSIEQAVMGLRGDAGSSAYTSRKQGERAGVIFMFPGQGSQYVNMGQGLYREVEEFRRHMDECAGVIEQQSGWQILKWIYPEAGQEQESRQRLRETAVTQPALYMVEYALAQTVMSYGVEPRGMIGHSIGEYVAATISGVLGMEEAIRLVVARGRLMQEMEGGAMLSVRGRREEVMEKIEGKGLSIAAENGPRQIVVSGGEKEIEELEEEMRRRGERVERLETSHGYHSAMMEEAARRYKEEVKKEKVGEVSRRYISNVTGGWVRGEEVKEGEYWGRQMREEVRFREGMEELMREEGGVYVEVGPGRAMSSLARQQGGWGRGRVAVSLMRQAQMEESDEEELMRGMGKMWASGVEIEWERVRRKGSRRRVELPSYPFEGRRHWIDVKGREEERAVEEEEMRRHARPEVSSGYEGPRDEVEVRVAEIWEELLGIRGVGVNDNFFELGGHSLLGTQLVTRLREEFGVGLPLRCIFESPTVAELAKNIPFAAEMAHSPAAGKIERVSREADLPLSFSQQRLWFLHHLLAGSPVYNVPAAVRFKGNLNNDALARALHEVIRRHESLRTIFPEAYGEPVQLILSECDFNINIIDLSSLADKEAEAHRLSTEEAQKPFDLACGPLFRVTLFRLDKDDHIALVVMHHIITDDWSMGILIRELSTLYSAFVKGNASPLPDLPFQYADIAAWQRQWLQGAVLEQQLEYWKRQLAGSPPILNLPTDAPRPAVQRSFGAVREFEVPARLMLSLKSLSIQQGTSLFMTLLAAFSTVLHRYTGQRDILVGSPIANRTRSEIEGLIGLFVNTLILRLDFSDNPRFLELLRRARNTVLEAHAHQDVPFERVIDELQPERSLSNMPIIQVMVALHATPPQITDLPDLKLSYLQVETRTSEFDLMFDLWETEHKLTGRIEFNTDLFNAITIDRMAVHFRTLLEAVAQDANQRITDLEMLTETERHQLLAEWNDTRSGHLNYACIHELFEERAIQMAHAPALISEESRLTYSQLNSKANQLAHYLRKLDIGPDVLVGVHMERSIELIIGILGILKAGGAYMPLDSEYPKERLATMIKDAQSPVMLTQQRLAVGLDGCAARIICLDSDWGIIASESESNPTAIATAENVGCVIYTSGSTGTPKGVLLRQGSLVRYAQTMGANYNINPGDRVLQFCSISFDISIEEIFTCFARGATLVLRTESMLSVPMFLQKCSEWNITVVSLPTAYWHELTVAMDEYSLELPSSLHTVVIAGERAIPERLAIWQKQAGKHPRLLNTYGPTETTIAVSLFNMSSFQSAQGILREVPIGRPIRDAQIYLLDQHLNPVPIGVSGELHIGGDLLSRGYNRHPDATAEKFIPNPFSDVPGERLYKTGDLARFLPDGNIEFIGRMDHQVKIRGYRVEVGEIQWVLSQHPDVRDNVVLAREDKPGQKQLAAYVVTSGKDRNITTELRNFMAEKLPKYMVPTAIVLLESLPLTPNGKLDSSALPPPSTDNTLMPASAPPSTATQQTLARIFCSVLGIVSVGIDDNFFSLGGDSILCIKVVGKANRAGIKLTPRLVFQHPTISELARVAQPLSATAPEEQAGEGPSPLTPIQRWLFAQRLAQVDQFNQGVVLKLPQGMRTAQVAAAMATLIERHDALRLRFEETALGWQARVTAPGQWQSITEVDLGCLRGRARRSAFERVSEELQRELSINRGPVVVAGVIRLGASQRGRLVIVIHHLCVDAVSWRVMVEELEEVLRQQELGERAQLGEKTAGYREWAEAVEEWGGGEPARRQAQYWERELVRVKGSGAIPVDNEGGKNRERDVGRERERLSREQSERVKKEVREVTGARVQEVMLWAVGKAISRWSGRREVVVDVEGHGRQEIGEGVDVSRSVGWFTTIYPVVIEVEQGSGWQEEVSRVSRRARLGTEAGLGYMMMKYGGEQQEQEQRRGGGREVAEVLFNYLGKNERRADEEGVLELSRQEVVGVRGGANERSHLIEINSQEVGGRLEVEWSYSRGVHRASSIEEVVRWWKEAIEEVVEGSKEVMREVEGRSGQEVEEVYELTPMQEGLLFETLYEQETGAYYVQTRIRVRGEIKYEEMRRAWEGVVRKHKVLRSGFEWEGMERGVQVVRRGVEVEVEEEDWRGGSREEQEERMREMMREDKERGVDVRRAPLMRVKVIREGEREYEIVWSSHHLILDGWSAGIVLKEVMEMYEMYEREDRGEREEEKEEEKKEEEEKERMSYREYVERVRSKDKDEAERYWRRRLRGNRGKTEMKVRRGRGEGYGSAEWRMSEEESREMERVGKEIGVTVSTMVQGGWVIVLSRYSGEEEVMYGMTVSGRGGEGEEGVVGLCINTMPVRVRSKGEERVRESMRRIQEEQVEQREYEYVGLVEVQRWGEEEGAGGKGEGLFDSLIVFENFPVDPSLLNEIAGIQIIDVRAEDPSHYPITLSVTPGRELEFRITYARNRFDENAIAQIVESLRISLQSLTNQPDATVAELIAQLEARDRQRAIEQEKESREKHRQRLKRAKPKVLAP